MARCCREYEFRQPSRNNREERTEWNHNLVLCWDQSQRLEYLMKISLSPNYINEMAKLTTSVLVTLVLAVGLSVTEKLFFHALAISARQFAFGAHWLVGLEDGQNLTGLYVKINKNICGELYEIFIRIK